MLVVVGGHTRNIGKTSVVAGLIAALPELNWTAIKITQYGHGVCSSAGEPCECAVADLDHPYAVSQETDSASGTDSSRYLAANWRTPCRRSGAFLRPANTQSPNPTAFCSSSNRIYTWR